MKCLKNCIFMWYIPMGGFICAITKETVNYGCTCPYENKTVTELNMEHDYQRRLKK